MELTDRQLLDALPDAMVVVAAGGTIVMVNRQTETLFGYARDELLGRRVEDLLPVRFRAPHLLHRQDYHARPRQRAMGEALDLFGLRKDGREFPVEISLSPVVTETETFVAGAIRDVTERKKISERRFRAIFQQTHQMAAIVGLDGTVLDVNRKALLLSGLAPADVIGRPIWETRWVSHSPPLQQQLRSAIDRAADNETVRFEGTHPRPDGTLAMVDISIRAAHDESGAVDFLVVESYDVSEQRHAEEDAVRHQAYAEALRQANELAESATATKSRFLAAASHDLRQPLQSLSLYLSAMMRQLDKAGDLDRELLRDVGARMRQSIDLMSELLNSLLDISRLDGGSVAPERRDIRLQDFLERIVTDNIQQAEEKGLTLSLAGDDCVVHSDPGLLERVVENFVTNAIRYTDQGRVVIQTQIREDLVRISVKDTGVGISTDQLDKVFEEYYQLDNPSRDRRKGLGLGLSIVKHIARLLDHPLEVDSTPGEGSTFTVSVPLGTSELVHDDVPLAPESRGDRNPIVLFVDDDPGIVDAITILFESASIDVHSASDGEGVLAHLAAGIKPDAIVSDFRLPGDNGVEVVKRVRQLEGENLPAVLMTGDTSMSAIQAADLPNCSVLRKPVDTEQLISLIERVVL